MTTVKQYLKITSKRHQYQLFLMYVKLDTIFDRHDSYIAQHDTFSNKMASNQNFNLTTKYLEPRATHCQTS